MGASIWDITVPYDADIQRAFERARALTFETGAYAGAERTPKTIEEAIEAEGEDGTHSILDIERVAPDRDQPALDPAKQLLIAMGLEKGELEPPTAYRV